MIVSCIQRKRLSPTNCGGLSGIFFSSRLIAYETNVVNTRRSRGRGRPVTDDDDF